MRARSLEYFQFNRLQDERLRTQAARIKPRVSLRTLGRLVNEIKLESERPISNKSIIELDGNGHPLRGFYDFLDCLPRVCIFDAAPWALFALTAPQSLKDHI